MHIHENKYIHSQLILNKEAENSSWGKRSVFSVTGVGDLDLDANEGNWTSVISTHNKNYLKMN